MRLAGAVLSSPLPLWESVGRLGRPFLIKNAEAELRLCRIGRCDAGEGFCFVARRLPLTPALSHKGRGSAPPPQRSREQIKQEVVR